MKKATTAAAATRQAVAASVQDLLSSTTIVGRKAISVSTTAQPCCKYGNMFGELRIICVCEQNSLFPI